MTDTRISNFIPHSPPGEFSEVFDEVDFLVGNAVLLKEEAFRAQYDKGQLIPVKICGSNFAALITDFNDLGNGRFYDPRSRQSFKYDHLRKEISEFKAWEPDRAAETWRRALEDSCAFYTQDHYWHGVCSVFGETNDDGVIKLTACIEDHQLKPKNCWNGRWRSIWSVSFTPDATVAEVSGILKVQGHYYEDGDMQLISSKDVKESLKISNEQQTVTEFMQLVEDTETKYQMALSENCQTLSDATFKDLRRLLPVTRTKMDWTKILSYNIGTELKHHWQSK